MTYSEAIEHLYNVIDNLDACSEKDALAAYFILQAIKELQHNKDHND